MYAQREQKMDTYAKGVAQDKSKMKEVFFKDKCEGAKELVVPAQSWSHRPPPLSHIAD